MEARLLSRKCSWDLPVELRVFPCLCHHWQDGIRPSWMNSSHHQCRLIVIPHHFTRQTFPSSVMFQGTSVIWWLLLCCSDRILNNFTSYVRLLLRHVFHRSQQTFVFGNKLSPSLQPRSPGLLGNSIPFAPV